MSRVSAERGGLLPFSWVIKPRMSTPETLIFIAAVVAAVAVMLLLLLT